MHLSAPRKAMWLPVRAILMWPVSSAQTGLKQITYGGKAFAMYPATVKQKPDIPSPCRAENRLEVLTVWYRGKRVTLTVQFSRGGQKSIFQDGLDGAWTIKIRRDLEENELAFLNRAYAHLESARRDTLVKQLTEMLTGEMQPFYIYRHGFYEGHTAWRTDPIVITFIFGSKSIQEIEAAFAGQLPQVLTQHFVGDSRQPDDAWLQPRHPFYICRKGP